MRFGPTLMTSARLIQEWPGIISSPAYATATAAIQAVSRPGYNTLVVRITRWPLTPLPVEPEDPSKQHLAINLKFLNKAVKLVTVVKCILLALSSLTYIVHAKVSLTSSLISL